MRNTEKLVAAASWADQTGKTWTVKVWSNRCVRLTDSTSNVPQGLAKLVFMRRERLGTDAWNRVLRDALCSSKDSADLVERLDKQTLLKWVAL